MIIKVTYQNLHTFGLTLKTLVDIYAQQKIYSIPSLLATGNEIRQ